MRRLDLTGMRRLDLAGSVVGVVALCLAYTPSLLPRDWLLQGLVGGLCATTGYALGVLARFMTARFMAARQWRAGRAAWSGFALLAGPAVALTAYRGWLWQHELGRGMGVAGPPGATWPAGLLLAVAVVAVLVGAARLIRRAGWGAAGVLGVLLLAGGSAPFGVLSSALDGRVTDVRAPASGERSGGPGSLVPWPALGRQGRAFVTGGLGTPHEVPPIRVYAGLGSAATAGERARLAVAELERTGAFDREVLCLVVPTGSGWVDEPTVAALEDEYDGDTALVAVQYAALPSWLSLATEPERAADAATVLLAEVRRVWSARPAADRPRLYIYGHSLGALAAQAPFGSVSSLLGDVDGALISGSPGDGPLRNRILTDGVTRPSIRFASGPADLSGPSRVVFLEHPTDPVVWWSPRAFWRDPHAPVRWWPVVSFWQLSGDLLKAQDVPAGFGHRYGAEARAAWQAIGCAQPPNDSRCLPTRSAKPVAGRPSTLGDLRRRRRRIGCDRWRSRR
jgi:uncharacterized membrane protein